MAKIARLPGPILLSEGATVRQCSMADAYNPDWLIEEIPTSIDTTAAGGNASLMTIA